MGQNRVSGPDDRAAKRRQGKPVVSHGKHREKAVAETIFTTDKVVVENNSLNIVIQGGKLAAQGCLKISACRDRLVGSGLGALLGVGASTSAMDALFKDEQMNMIKD